MWRDYFPAVDAIVFLVDAGDCARFPEARAELDSLLGDEDLRDCPILILANKIDRPGAVSETELRLTFPKYFLFLYKICRQVLGLYNLTGKGKIRRTETSGRPLEVFMISVLHKQGYGEAFRWMAQYL